MTFQLWITLQSAAAELPAAAEFHDRQEFLLELMAARATRTILDWLG
jgi:hypothetical protein